MYHPHAKFLLLALFIFWGITLSAQTTTSSGTNTSNPLSDRENNPYSKYGIGELQDGNSAVLRGMGGITSAFENPYELNTDNPASLSFLKRTTFEAGFTASTRNVSSQGSSYTTGTATLSYLTIGIPVNNNAGLCFGFKPYTRAYYSLVDTLFSSPLGETIRSYNGDGGLNYAYLGFAYRYKELSVGVTAGYMFGTLINNTQVESIDTTLTDKSYVAEFTNYDRIGGLYWKAGLMYEHKFDSSAGYTFRFGGTVTISQKLSEKLNAYQVSIYNYGDTIVNDTSSYSGQSEGKLKLPLSYSIGAMIVKDNKWALGIDYTATQWSGFNSTPDAALNYGIASHSYKISAGGEYTPDANNFRNYYSKITYRAGLYYGTDYLVFQNTQLPVYGFTLGASLPIRRSTSHLHASLDVGRLGTTANNLIEETYVRFSLGLSFNQDWFVKRKYD